MTSKKQPPPAFRKVPQYQWRVIATHEGRVSPFKFHEGPTDVSGDIRLHIRYFTYRTDAGLVAGRNHSDMFTIDRPAKDVWPIVKDFNLWSNSYGYYYSGVLGDLEGQIYGLSDDPNDYGVMRYEILKVVPEHMILIGQPVPEDDRVAEANPGTYGPGFHQVMLHEHEGKTIVTIYTEHSYLSKDKTEEEALQVWRKGAQELLVKFRDHFIPNIKRLVYEGKAAEKS